MKNIHLFLAPLLWTQGIVNAISLFSADDSVVELVNANISTLDYSDSIWLVQFYSHWCGSCQRFAPTWKRLADDIKDWSPIVKVGAMNCAEQSCDLHQVTYTPTVKLMNPYMRRSGMYSAWKEVSGHLPIEVYKSEIIAAIMIGDQDQSARMISAVRNMPRSGPQLDSMFGEGQYMGIVFSDAYNQLAPQVILDMNQHREQLPVYFVPDFPSDSSIQWGVTVYPTLIIVDKNLKIVEKETGSYTSTTRNQFGKKLKGYLNSGNSKSTRVTTSAPSTSWPVFSPKITFPQESDPKKAADDNVVQLPPPELIQEDVVYQGDLERAVQFALLKEVPMQRDLNGMKRSALINFVGALIDYYPNQSEGMSLFLSHLKFWLLTPTYISTESYKTKVAVEDTDHQTFANTPDDYTGCKGSKETYRGYPCALWSLFHALSVNAAKKHQNENMFGLYPTPVNNVANAVIDYVSNFFSCRECAMHFQNQVNELGLVRQDSGSFSNGTVLWLWELHNMANSRLSGETSEDPRHPKIQWPAASNCPECYLASGGMNQVIPTSLNSYQKAFDIWNTRGVLDYFFKVYGPENIVKTPTATKPVEKSPEEELEDLIQKIKNSPIQLNEVKNKLKALCPKLS